MVWISVLVVLMGGYTLSSAQQDSILPFQFRTSENYFDNFTAKYGKQYANETERKKRFEIFKSRLKFIHERNYEKPIFGVNQFSDWTHDEFFEKHKRHPPERAKVCDVVLPFYIRRIKVNVTKHKIKGTTKKYEKHKKAPTSTPNSSGKQRWKKPPVAFDWRHRNKVTKVKDVENCSSHYAVAAIENLESQYAIHHNKLLTFSVQHLIDCDLSSHACDGGQLVHSAGLLVQMGAILEQDYVSKDHYCEHDPDDVKIYPEKCSIYYIKDENKLKLTLYNVGPLAVGIDIRDFQDYAKGIMECSANAKYPWYYVLLVGYGTERGVPYWIIKNAWGKTWGENGYIRIKRGSNSCGILDKNNHFVSVILPSNKKS